MNVTSSPPSAITVLYETSIYQKFTKCPFNKACINLEDVIFTNIHIHTYTQHLANNIKINPLHLKKKNQTSFKSRVEI